MRRRSAGGVRQEVREMSNCAKCLCHDCSAQARVLREIVLIVGRQMLSQEDAFILSEWRTKERLSELVAELEAK